MGKTGSCCTPKVRILDDTASCDKNRSCFQEYTGDNEAGKSWTMVENEGGSTAINLTNKTCDLMFLYL